MNTIKRHTMLGILILIFLAPGLAACLFYTHPHWLAGAQTNRGQLLNPPLLLNEFPLSGKWGLVLHSESCDKLCLDQLDRLARMRLALGRQLYQVSLSLLTEPVDPIPLLQNHLLENDIGILSLHPTTRVFLSHHATEHIFIVDPKGYCILAYPLNAPPHAIYQDLKRLLTTSGKNSV